MIADLPHSYPFRFVDRVLREPGPEFADGRVSARITAGGRGSMNGTWGTPTLLAEAIAQAALLLEGRDPDATRRGFLAGIEGFEIRRVPEVGETLTIDVRLAARFGAIVRFEGEVQSGSETVARGAVLVRRGIP